MDKKEKYINFIVDGLVKKTEIRYDEERIKLPYYHHYVDFIKTIYRDLESIYPPPVLGEYLKMKYGSRQGESETIYKIYRQRIIELIKK